MYSQNHEVGDKYFSDELIDFGSLAWWDIDGRSPVWNGPSYYPILKDYFNSYTVTAWATELALSSFSLTLKKIF